ncbi:MAG TPA: tetratricopeptide repeat protein [Bryobacteraceae bacterium]|nr:tetratricopeptide repeat protein [Bryobacteraceae bacterium]
MTRWVLLLVSVLWAAQAAAPRYEVRGRLVPGTRATVWLHGATAPFEANTLADDDGHFRFRDIEAGAYVLGAFVPGRGEMRRTIEVGPGEARAGNRIELVVELHDGEFESRDSLRRSAMVSAKELAIPASARHEYEEAVRNLARHEVDAATGHLQRAVEMAPQFAEAWNHLGTIAYQTHDFPRAESCFRKALAADPSSFQPLVNLGGVLINLNKFDEALKYNLFAALSHPSDALANVQLGMSYFFLNKLDLAQKYLTAARRIDPAHFSHPQLILAQIDLRRNDRAGAAAELAEFLQYHPDSPQKDKIRDDIARLRGQPDAPQEFAQTGMARSFALKPDLPSPPARVDAAIGSGRHMRVLLARTPDGGWTELPSAWYPQDGGHYAAGPAFGFSDACLACHGAGRGHAEPMNCTGCHDEAGAAKPGEAACLRCHAGTVGPDSAHRPLAATDETIELNSAAYRLRASRCYRASAGKLTCTACHPAHRFAKTADEFRAVCRGCHPTQHNSAALNCVRCHMPPRPAADAPSVLVTDHRIQRPL